MLSGDDVKKIALLARLNVGEAEVARFQKQLTSILDYVGQLEKVDVAAVAPTSHAQGTSNVFRDDLATQTLTGQDVVAMAPASSGTYIKVPIIIDQESE